MAYGEPAACEDKALGIKALRTKAALREAALSLWKERGFDAVTVEEIAAAAGVSKASFYTYYDAKSDIVVDEFRLIDAFYERFAREELGNYRTAREGLVAFARAQFGFVRDEIGHGSLKVLYASQTAQSGGDKILVDPGRHWVRIVEDLIAEGQEEGEFRTDLDARRLAALHNRAARGVFLDWCLADGGFDLVGEGLACLEGWILPALRAGAARA